MTHIRDWTKDSHKGTNKDSPKGLDNDLLKVFNRDLTKVLSMAILRREEDEKENEIL
jgi:hypothetical protein